MQERRSAKRIRTNLKARWEGLSSQSTGSVYDLGSAGCFVLSGGAVRTGELIRLEIHFPNQIAFVWGHVVYAISEMGFALRFVFASDDEMRALALSVDDSTDRS